MKRQSSIVSFPSSGHRIKPNLASHSRVALASMASNTGSSSPGDELMTLRFQWKLPDVIQWKQWKSLFD
jgi:hypothetical protein